MYDFYNKYIVRRKLSAIGGWAACNLVIELCNYEARKFITTITEVEIGNRLNHSRLVISDSGLSHSRQHKARPRVGHILAKY